MRIFAALAPILAFAFLVVWVRRRVPCWRMSLLVAAVLWGVTVVAFTEGLSLLHALSFSSILVLWLLLGGVLAWAGWRQRASLAEMSIVPPEPIGWVDRVFLLGVVGIVATLGVLALVAPPNNNDSMVYHMSRVVHWIQNTSVAHYATPVSLQLHMPPWAEFAILHLQVLTGGDRLANLVQWFSMVGSLIGASLLAKQLGGDRRSEILAAVVAATIPMGIMQASSTQNDYVVTFWLVCLGVFVILINRQSSGARVTVWALLVGAALGLALLTKATAYIFALPLMLWMSVVRVRRDGFRAWRAIVLVVAVTAVLNAGHYGRNVEKYGAPLGSGREVSSYVNTSFGVRSLISVAVRNVGLHLGTRWRAVNALMNAAGRDVHRFLGLNLNDPATTLTSSFEVSLPVYHEDAATNGGHVLLVVLAIGAVAGCADLRRRRELVTYSSLLVTGFLLFSLILRWQPWHIRLHLPLFVLWAPVLGVVLGQRPRLGAVSALALMMAAVPWLLFNESRSLVGQGSVFRQEREAQYFANRPDLRQPYTEAVSRLTAKGCTAIGLLMGDEAWEYPLWVLAQRSPGKGQPRLEHVDVPAQREPALAKAGGHHFTPCGVIATRPVFSREFRLDGLAYRRVWLAPLLFLPEGQTEGRQAGEDVVALLQREGASTPGMWTGARVRIQVSATTIREGETLRVGIDVQALPLGPPSRVSVGVVGPDRCIVIFVSSPRWFTHARELRGLRDLVPLRTLDAGTTWQDESVINVIVPRGIPVGTYHVFAVLTRETSREALAVDVETVEVTS